MTRKKRIKKLMGLGVQRNDAAGFVNTYQALIDTGKENLLPVILRPVPELAIKPTIVQPGTFVLKRVVFHNPRIIDKELERESTKIKIAEELGRELLRKGYIKIETSPAPHFSYNPPGNLCSQPPGEYIEATEYFAAIRVLPPKEGIQ